jgi:hypothetical protein
MTSAQRMQLAQFMAGRPVLALLLVYAVCFLAYSLPTDFFAVVWPSLTPMPNRYIFPLPLAAVTWLGLYTSSRRIVRAATK